MNIALATALAELALVADNDNPAMLLKEVQSLLAQYAVEAISVIPSRWVLFHIDAAQSLFDYSTKCPGCLINTSVNKHAESCDRGV